MNMGEAMSKRMVSPDFFATEAPALAPLLLGKLLCRRGEDGQIKRLRITETEAYYTQADTACHAHKGRTPRTEILYGPGGLAYVYLCYGIHSLLNVVCGPMGSPQAVLIRGAGQFAGPGRLTKALDIRVAQNGQELATSAELWLEDDGQRPGWHTAKRVGITYAAQEDIDRLWRFLVD